MQMSQEQKFQERIEYKGDLAVFSAKVSEDFGLGKYRSYKVVPVGYEDLNIVLETDMDRFLVKALSKERSEASKERYAQIIEKAIEAGVAHPKLYKSEQGYLHKTIMGNVGVSLMVLQFIEG